MKTRLIKSFILIIILSIMITILLSSFNSFFLSFFVIIFIITFLFSLLFYLIKDVIFQNKVVREKNPLNKLTGIKICLPKFIKSINFKKKQDTVKQEELIEETNEDLENTTENIEEEIKVEESEKDNKKINLENEEMVKELSSIAVDFSNKELSDLRVELEESKEMDDETFQKITHDIIYINDTYMIENSNSFSNYEDYFKIEDKRKNGEAFASREKNVVKKGLELKEKEITELFQAVVSDKQYSKTFFNKYLNEYLLIKYLRQGLFNEYSSQFAIEKYINTYLNDFSQKLVTPLTKEKDLEKIDLIRKCFLVVNKVDYNNVDIEEIIDNEEGFLFKDKKKVISDLSSVKKKYVKLIDEYGDKLKSTDFELSLKSVSNDYEDLINTNLNIGIKFNKIFSDYIINKSFENKMIAEDVALIKTKSISFIILNDMLKFKYEKKYLLHIPGSLLKKVNKMKSLLNSIFDEYSQSKIYLLLKLCDINSNYSNLIKYKKMGFQIVVQATSEDITLDKNAKRNLCLCSYIFSTDPENIDMNNVPMELWKKIIPIEESLIESVVLK